MEHGKNIPKALLSEKQNLGKVAPLATPFVIEIGVSSFCNLKCKFCFHYNNTFEKHMMSLELFRKIIDDFNEFPEKLKKLKICGYGENLLNPYFIDMLNYATSAGITDFVELTTNGIPLTHEMSKAIVDSGMRQINFSIEAVNGQGYLDICGKKIDMDALVENIRFLYEYKTKVNPDIIVYIKVIDKNLKDKSEEQQFFEMFGDISDYLFVEHLIDMWLDDSNETVKLTGPAQNVYGIPLKNNYVCSFIFTRFIIHADGLCVPCCSDWNKACVIGDLKTQSAYSIWNSDKLRKLQLLHLTHRKEAVSLCEGCRVYDLNSADNIDGYEQEILARLSNDCILEGEI
jgi:MoaA/NifB/PqqE/SkfB family radical SAM enzyme